MVSAYYIFVYTSIICDIVCHCEHIPLIFLSGSEAKHRWDTLRNLYGRARREIVALTKQQGLSGSGKDNVSYEDLLTPQSMATHRFMAPLYVPRK